MRIELVHVPKVVRVAGQLDSLFAMAMPMGLFALADRVDRLGHDVEILHAGVELQRDPAFELIDALADRSPDLVGLSLHWHHQLADVLAQVVAIRSALPGAHLTVGGLTATAFDRELLERYPAIDTIVRGDGELPLEQLVGCLEAGTELESVANLTWRRDGEIVRNPLSWFADEATLSATDFARLDLLRHAERYTGDPWHPLYDTPPSPPSRRTFHLCSGRGCDWECAFCAGCATSQRLLAGRSAPVLRSAASVVGTIRRLADQGIESLYLCHDPAVATARGYYLDLFGQIRRAGLRPTLEFECFTLPSAELIAAFSQTFDLQRSKLVLSPGTVVEAHRRRFHGPWYSNDQLEQVLGVAQDQGVSTHLCFSIYPPEGWADARALVRWQRRLAERFRCSRFLCPIEMEPAAPWHREPGRYGLEAVRSTLEQFRDRHSREGHHERAWEQEVGYATTDLSARTLLLRSAMEEEARWVAAALSGLWRPVGTRIVLGPAEELDAILDTLGRWQPGRLALVLSGQLRDDQKEEVARRICAASHSVARLFFTTSGVTEGGDTWKTVPHRVAPWGGHSSAEVLTALVLADRKGAAQLLRREADDRGRLVRELRAQDDVFMDGCRFGGQSCPARQGRRLVFDGDGNPRACLAWAVEGGAGARWSEVIARFEHYARQVEQARGCACCAVRSQCPRCPAPAPFGEAEYCTIMRSRGSLRGLMQQRVTALAPRC